ncbi:aTPase/histidine kinase/DNA gyrase B/HSP90 domain protein [Clostridium sp. CAG:567]|jgi:two-component system sensor histidine kinase VanS|nr:aTPase/histidine kinase/DNA gyrase B/HSP90 domain protein [Clostridium sp. CAG:567]
MIKEKLKSVRVKLFLVLCVVTILLVICLIAINSLVLENFYIYNKTNTIKEVYNKINKYYKDPDLAINLETELKKIAFRNNFDILIQSDTDLILFSTNKDFLSSIEVAKEKYKTYLEERKNLLYSDAKMTIRKIDDTSNSLNYILLYGKLDNGYSLYIRIPIAPIEESVRISNNTLIVIGIATVIISAFVASLISKRFTSPILQLNDITKKMAKLDFEQKYRINDSDDEINELGKNINTMSDKLESTIKQLRETNSELEKDIEEKSKIDEMRKQFISDVSHELKTPIALIQGYAEGLIENVNNDDESRKFYAEVILDESNKMDVLVKQLLELMKLEYGKRKFNDEEFDVVELINEVIRKCNVMLEENQIQVVFDEKKPIYAYADDFYVEQVVTNYFTNAIKHAKEVNGKKQIKITIQNVKNKIRVSVFNTGDKIPEEDLTRVWGRFYKIDDSRNRENSGSGIGLSIVKAIQNNYQNEYGVQNLSNGVEFYFDISTKK